MHIKTGRRVLVAEVREGTVYPAGRILKLLGDRDEGWRVAKWVIGKGIMEGRVYIFEDELPSLIEELKSYPVYLKRSYKGFLVEDRAGRSYKEYWELYRW